jgi:ribokinase
VKDLRDHGVDVSSVATLDGSRTGAAYVFVDARSENFVVLDPGANRDLSARAVTARLDAAGLTPRDVLLTSGEVSTEVVDAAADVARRHGATHVHNLAPVHALGPWSRSDRVLLVVNELEAAQATSGLGPSAAALELSAGRRGALVTLGSRGAAVADGRVVLLVPSPAVRAVDSTGAGDAFCGALAAALSAGCSLPTAAEIAVRAGAQAVTAFGARGDLDQPPDDADPTGPGAVRPTHQPPSQRSAH